MSMVMSSLAWGFKLLPVYPHSRDDEVDQVWQNSPLFIVVYFWTLPLEFWSCSKRLFFRSCKKGVAANEDDEMVLALFVTDPDANTEDEAGPSDIQDEEEEVELELEDETTEAGDIEEDEEEFFSVSFP